MDADDLLNRLDSIDTVDAAATWAAQACMEIAKLRATIGTLSDIEGQWKFGLEPGDAAMERISEALLVARLVSRKH